MVKLSQSVTGIKPYYFYTLQTAINERTREGLRVIRLDIGSPDLPPPAEVLQTLGDALQLPGAHGYIPTQGPAAYREAVRSYYDHRFQVQLDPQSEIVPLLGSKEGIIHLQQVLLDPGDEVLVPNPGYPSYAFGAEQAGATVHSYPLLPENHFLPDLDQIKQRITGRTKLIWLNFPGNPTGSTVSLSFFEALVDLARETDVMLIHDAPYTDVYFEESPPPSILSVPGAADVAVEINSLSKTYHLAGWRIGMACGNRTVLNGLLTLKSKVDNSTSLPIYLAASAALGLNRNWINQRNQHLSARRDLFSSLLRHLDTSYTPPQAGYYLWCKIPAGFSDDMDFCQQALRQYGISITPGSIYGTHGAGYFRLSICQPMEILHEAVDILQAWLQ